METRATNGVIEAMNGLLQLGWALMYLHGKFGAEIPHNRQTLPELAGTTVETAIHFTRKLSKQGIITTRRGEITVLEPQRLEEFAARSCEN